MQITFYQFSKRTNSTKIVDVTGTDLTCELKGTCNMFNPVLIIRAVPAAWNPIWNYCYIPAFKRYYFVNNWNWLNGVWECSLVCDVLASFRTEIGDLTEYVMRSSYEFDPNIQDNMYITKTEVHPELQLLPEFYVRAMTAGFYVIGIIGKETTATQGAITYYQMTPGEMARLRAYLLSDTFLSDQGLVNLADFVPADATKVIYNPYQYIVSCMWFPFPDTAIPSSFKTHVNTIDFGWWNTGTGFSANRISDAVPIYTRSEDISLISHPQAAARGEYLNHSPYTTRVLRMTPFNEVQLPDEYLTSIDKLTIELQCDFITGIGALILHAKTLQNTDKMIMTRLTAKIGVDIQLAQVGSDYLGAMTQAVQDTAGLINTAVGEISHIDLSNWVSMGLTSFKAGFNIGMAQNVYDYAGLNNYLKAKAPQLLTSGSNGSLLMFAQNNYLCNTFYLCINDDNAQLGRPLCQVRTLKDIPGFMIVRSPDVAIPCFETERELIIQFLSSGFFYE